MITDAISKDFLYVLKSTQRSILHHDKIKSEKINAHRFLLNQFPHDFRIKQLNLLQPISVRAIVEIGTRQSDSTSLFTSFIYNDSEMRRLFL